MGTVIVLGIRRVFAEDEGVQVRRGEGVEIRVSKEETGVDDRRVYAGVTLPDRVEEIPGGRKTRRLQAPVASPGRRTPRPAGWARFQRRLCPAGDDVYAHLNGRSGRRNCRVA